MNVATLLIHSSLFLIGFILLGLLARWLYHRNVVTPHNRQINALVNDFIRLWRDSSDLRKDNLRLKQNLTYLGDRHERVCHKHAQLRRTVELLKSAECARREERDAIQLALDHTLSGHKSLEKDLEAALHRIDDLTASNHRLEKLLHGKRKDRN